MLLALYLQRNKAVLILVYFIDLFVCLLVFYNQNPVFDPYLVSM